MKFPSKLDLVLTTLAATMTGCGGAPDIKQESPETTAPIANTEAQIISNKLGAYIQSIVAGPVKDDEAGRCEAVEMSGTNRYTFLCKDTDESPYSFTVQTNNDIGCQISPSYSGDSRFPPVSIYATSTALEPSYNVIFGAKDRCTEQVCNGQKMTPADSALILKSGRAFCKTLGRFTGNTEFE